jgi:hypothetical protein
MSGNLRKWLQIKYAAGIYARFKINTKNSMGLFNGLGPFYEYETWDYSGAKVGLVSADHETITNKQIKIASYFKFPFNIDHY